MTGPDHVPPVTGDPGRRLTDEEYDQTYASGTGGHQVPPEVAATLSGYDDPEAVPPT